jgi:hypothetical protein
MRCTSRLASAAVVLLVSLSIFPESAVAAPSSDALSGKVLREYARDTWRSMVAMVDPATALPADNIAGTLAPETRSAYTSPTNIGGYLWSTVAARDLGVIAPGEASRRVRATLDGLSRLDRHDATGMFYNWYDPHTGAVLHTWPVDGSPVTPFLSSVDNGWLAAALLVAGNAVPAARSRAQSLLRDMDFGFYYNPVARGPDFPAGLIRGGFWDTAPTGCSVPDRGVWFTCNHYDITVTEPRIASYLGIAFGQIPPAHYFATMRTFPDTCDWSWAEQQPVGFHTSYLGVPVFEGAYRYQGIQFVPSWGGDMFEALMPDLFVPEAAWGPRSWGRNHPATVAGQIAHGLRDAGYGYWGFSPASDPMATGPAGGYRAWGAEPMGMDPGGYPSDVEGANFDPGFGPCRPPGPAPSYGDGVVTPHAVFLALPYARQAAVDNLARLRADFDVYGPGGFYDSVAVRSGTVARRYLALDQSMVLGALGNVLAGNAIRRAFVTPEIERALRPLLAMETFNVPEPA